MPRSCAVVSLLLLSLFSVASASCIAFDAKWNLLAFNFGGKDYDAGTQESWGQGNPTDITTQGRPPFNGANISCYLSQFFNAIYVLGADSSNPAAVHIYDATAKSWSTQSVNTGKFDPSDFAAILDRDTNVFYAYSKGELFSLDMESLKAASDSTKEWVDVQQVDWDTTSYRPTMALAQNHIHFLGVPALPDGSAKIFVIHFSFMQPEPQSYGRFPNTHGQTTSFFNDTGVQTKFAFIPDDGSATYVIDVTSNATTTLKGPASKDARASYFASTSALVQLASSGTVSYIPFNQEAQASDLAADWISIAKLPTTATPSASVTRSGNLPSGTAGQQGASASSGSTTSNGAEVSIIGHWSWGVTAVAILAGVVLF